MLELSTPIELIQKISIIIETRRKLQNIQQKELSQKANIPLPTYKDFLYKQKISLENLFKLLIALNLFDNINGLLKKEELKTLDEIKNEIKLPKRVIK
jgi:hypothetical protein